MLGEDIDFGFEWISLYRFQSRRLARFRHGRVLFAGDAAHQMSPFGARGGNSGMQDADNLAWKLDLVLRRLAPESLLDSYDVGADRCCRREFAQHHAFDRFHCTQGRDQSHLPRRRAGARRDGAVRPPARQFGAVVGGRQLRGSPLNGPDDFAAGECPSTRPGAAAIDAPVADAWLLEALGDGFVGVCFGRERTAAGDLARANRRLSEGAIPIKILMVSDEIACRRYGAERTPAYYLFRPDQHVAARWRALDAAALAGVRNGPAAVMPGHRHEREGSRGCLSSASQI